MAEFGLSSNVGADALEMEFPGSLHEEASNESNAYFAVVGSGGFGVDRSFTNLRDAQHLEPSANFFNWQFKAKRCLDVAVVASAIFALAPLLILVALAIVIESRGPVLFIQEREGKGGRLFRAFKFRSMRQEDCDHSGIHQTIAGDSRVTQVGRFIRRTSIDELPQLLNVLVGDMSLVGPRPHVRGMMAAGQEYRTLVPYYDLRLLVAPGLTGWAQANGLRGPTTNAEHARERIRHDLAYILHFNIWLDIKILALTLKREVVGGTGH